MSEADYTIQDAGIDGRLLFAARSVLRESSTSNRLAAHSKFMLCQVASTLSPSVVELAAALRQYSANIEASSHRETGNTASTIAVVSVPNLERQISLLADVESGILTSSEAPQPNVVCLRLPVETDLGSAINTEFGVAVDTSFHDVGTPNSVWLAVTRAVRDERAFLANVSMWMSSGTAKVEGSVLPHNPVNSDTVLDRLSTRFAQIVAAGDARASPFAGRQTNSEPVSNTGRRNYMSLVGNARVGLIHDVVSDLDVGGVQVMSLHMAILEGRSCALFELDQAADASQLTRLLRERVQADYVRFSAFSVEPSEVKEAATRAGQPWRCALELVFAERPGVLFEASDVVSRLGFRVESMDSRVVGSGERSCEVLLSLYRPEAPEQRLLAALEGELRSLDGSRRVDLLPRLRGVSAATRAADGRPVFAFSLERADLPQGVVDLDAQLVESSGPEPLRIEVWSDDRRLGTAFTTVEKGEPREVELRWEPTHSALVNVLAHHRGRLVWQQSVSLPGKTADPLS